jgi:transcriptional regulator with PAS, ATPase and Fis domain
MFVRIEPGRRPVSTIRVAIPVSAPKDALTTLDTGDERMRSAIERARRVLGKPISLLLQGESGVGKELFARAVHDAGPGGAQPFVAVNCSALPETLIDSELFGYAPGAFTGARRDGAPGCIREAHGGTLLLDEIGDMPLPVQGRLLRVLQERQVTPLGGGKPVAVDFGLVCATHRDLKVEIAAGRFRPDLYYRINGLMLTLPPLHKRSDFHTLVSRMLREAVPGREIILDAEVAAAFASYRWPGNLRQLANSLRTACALLEDGETHIAWRHLSDDLVEDLRSQGMRASASGTMASTQNLRALSDSVIGHAVSSSGGNMSEAARRLGISRNTLYRRLKRGSAQQLVS